MKKILVIRWKSIGDVAFTLPAVNRIRDNFPDARMTFLVSKENAFVVEGFEAVDRIWTVDRAALKEGRYLAGVASFLGLLRQIRRERFDLVVDFQAYGETALMARISGAKERWGNAKPSLRSRAYTRNYTEGRRIHPASRHLAMLEAFGLQATPVRNDQRLESRFLDEARRHLESQGIRAGTRLVYFQPCTSAVAKNWPMDRYLAVAGWLRERGIASVFGGGAFRECGAGAGQGGRVCGIDRAGSSRVCWPDGRGGVGCGRGHWVGAHRQWYGTSGADAGPPHGAPAHRAGGRRYSFSGHRHDPD